MKPPPPKKKPTTVSVPSVSQDALVPMKYWRKWFSPQNLPLPPPPPPPKKTMISNICMVRVFINTNLNNISVIPWQSVLWWKKPPTCCKSLTNFITMLYRIHLTWEGFELIILVVMGTDCTGNCKSIYHAITATKDHQLYVVAALQPC